MAGFASTLRTAKWLTRLTPEDVRMSVHPFAYERGVGYADAERVIALYGEASRLTGLVAGSEATPYAVIVTVRDVGRGRVSWTSRCSCPLETDCKHVVAALLTAIEVIAPQAPPPPAPDAWRGRVETWVREAAAQAEEKIAVGLRFAMTSGPRAGGELSVIVTPTRMGKSGRWHKEVRWSDLEYDAARVYDTRQARAAVELRNRFRNSNASRYVYGDTMMLQFADAAVWPALQAAIDAGVTLVPGYQQDFPIRFELRRREPRVQVQRDPDGSIELQADLESVPGGRFVGEPLHAVISYDDAGLQILGFAAPVSPIVDALIREGSLHVPAADADEFLQVYYPRLAPRIETAAPIAGEIEQPEPLRLRLTLSPAPGAVDGPPGIGVRAHMFYAGRFAQDVSLEHTSMRRDRAMERDLVQRLVPVLQPLGLLETIGGLGWWPRAQHVLSDEGALALIDGLEELRAHDDLVLEMAGELPVFEESGADPLIEIATHQDPDDPDWLNLMVTISIDGESVPIGPLIKALAQDKEVLVLPSGTWFTLDKPELLRLRDLLAEAREIADRPSGVAINRYQVGLWDELEQLGIVDEQAFAWQATVKALRSHGADLEAELPDGLKAELRPYQRTGYGWLHTLWSAGLGGVLADDMGLGKTLQTLALLESARVTGDLDDKPVLVVAPSSVVGTWVSEAAKFAPDLNVVPVVQTSARRGAQALADQVRGAHVVVTSYAVLRLDAEAFHALPWRGLILDEAQNVKNHQSKTFHAAKRIGAPFTLAMTGTPLENSLMDLWAMFALAAPGLYPRPEQFAAIYRKPIESGDKPERLDQLRRRIRPLMLRRTKSEVATDLPDKQIQVQNIALGTRHTALYKRHLQRERQRMLGLLEDPEANRIAILASLTRLRQLALDPSLVDEEYAARELPAKLAFLVEQIQEVSAEGHRALVFSQFTRFLGRARDALEIAGLSTSYLDGSMTAKARQKEIDAFRSGDQSAFLISLKAGGTGLTLTEADYVFVLDPWWNPAAEAQAIDRAHRIGQDKPVTVYRLVSAETIEEKVLALQERKRDLFTQVVDDGGALSGGLTAQDLRGLFE
ncbi:DEAD/DEAH box helicase [Branchiibius sp. NY16-3462-2]|uniref:DEAD/DEAH box helicase n=1 Tax=Branchiibius sp. NY16-3462-2 TaxID=1807500 RepID=UPI000793E0D0|nr:DEAD/DEAH box helicase [Branchiibius sp. NY16-3462-2]KYH43368.1 hypothetical protein AZH51_16525 [Branchiibius sp. NY16-3462-2]